MAGRAKVLVEEVYAVTILACLSLLALWGDGLALQGWRGGLLFLLLTGASAAVVALAAGLGRRFPAGWLSAGSFYRHGLPIITLGVVAVAAVAGGGGSLSWLGGLYLIPTGGSALQLGRRGSLPVLLPAILLLLWPWPPPAYSLANLAILGLNWWMLGARADGEAREQERLLHLANRDGLTGLFNHRYFQEKLEEYLARARLEQESLSLVLLDIDNFKIYNDAFGHQQGDVVLKAIAGMLQDKLEPPSFGARYGGEEFAMILPGVGASGALELAERLRREVEQSHFLGSEVQPGGKITISAGISSFPELAESRGELIRLADLALYRVKFVSKNRSEIYFSLLDGLEEALGEQEKELVNSLRAMLNVINAKDHYTYGHSERVAAYTDRLAARMGMGERERQLLGYAAFLHDLGKIEVPREILVKPGPLRPEEWEVLKSHSAWGAEIITSFHTLGGVAEAVLHHHENFDGSGYPDGLKGEEIPSGSRLVRIMDSFDDLTSSRPYRSPLSEREALEEINRQAGVLYDPALVREFTVLILGSAS